MLCKQRIPPQLYIAILWLKISPFQISKTLNIKALELYCNIRKWNIELYTLVSYHKKSRLLIQSAHNLSGWPDSNWRPRAPQTCALPTALHPVVRFRSAKLMYLGEMAKLIALFFSKKHILIILMLPRGPWDNIFLVNLQHTYKWNCLWEKSNGCFLHVYI